VYPAVLFSTIVNGAFFVALISMGVLSVQIFSAPPYLLSPGQVGLTNLPLFIVALIANPLAGWLSDAGAKWMAKRNNGTFEPEFRMLLMIPAAILSTVAFVGFGISAERELPLPWLIFYASVLSLAVPFAIVPALTYVIDCHPMVSSLLLLLYSPFLSIFTQFGVDGDENWKVDADKKNRMPIKRS